MSKKRPTQTQLRAERAAQRAAYLREFLPRLAEVRTLAEAWSLADGYSLPAPDTAERLAHTNLICWLQNRTSPHGATDGERAAYEALAARIAASEG